MSKRRVKGEGSVYRRKDGRYMGEYTDATDKRRYVSGKNKQDVATKPVKQIGGAVLILDHINKANSGGGARGSTAKLAKVDVAWKLEGKQFDRNTTAELTIKKDKDRIGCLPKKRSFTVGGDGNGNLIFDTGEVSNANDPSELTGNPRVAYEVLVDEYPDGATFTQWEESSTEDEQMSASTFSRVRKELVEGELVSHDKSSGLYVANV